MSIIPNRMVGPRVSKEEFMAALGLTARDELYYRAMRDEAVKVYTLMNADPTNLLDSLRSDPTIQPPYYWHNIRPECQRWGILEIWRTSSPHTRPLFDLGATSGEHGPNWVAGWLLYSVFRSRDARNNRNRRRRGVTAGNGVQVATGVGVGGQGANGVGIMNGVGVMNGVGSVVSGTGENGEDGEVDAEGDDDPAEKQRQPGEPPRQGYYDPVRNGTYD